MPVAPASPSLGEQVAELSREIGLRKAGVARTRRAEGTTEAQAAYADGCLYAALLTLRAVRDGTLPSRRQG